MKRAITKIILHSSATGPSTKMEAIRKYHKEVKGWKDIGYHYVIEYDGLIRNGRDKDTAGAHCEGYNQDSFGICMVGGLQANGSFVNFTASQLDSLKMLIEGIFMTYGRLPVYPHHQFNKEKSCPNFRVDLWIKDGMPNTPSKYQKRTWE